MFNSLDKSKINVMDNVTESKISDNETHAVGVTDYSREGICQGHTEIGTRWGIEKAGQFRLSFGLSEGRIDFIIICIIIFRWKSTLDVRAYRETTG